MPSKDTMPLRPSNDRFATPVPHDARVAPSGIPVLLRYQFATGYSPAGVPNQPGSAVFTISQSGNVSPSRSGFSTIIPPTKYVSSAASGSPGGPVAASGPQWW